MKEIKISPQVETLLCEVIGDDFRKEEAERKLNETAEKAKINVVKNSFPVTLAPPLSGPCC